MKPIGRQKDTFQNQVRGTSAVRLAANCIGLGLVIMSIVHELKLPARERTWHGLLFGHIPYDWRLPTLSRIHDRFWQPGASLLQPTVFGVGWSINVGILARPFVRSTFSSER